MIKSIIIGITCFALGAIYQDSQAIKLNWDRIADEHCYVEMIQADLKANRPIISFDQYLINISEESDDRDFDMEKAG